MIKTVPIAIDDGLIERFWASVDVTDDDSCWEWTGSKTRKGYGELGQSHSLGNRRAHRVSWTIHNGEIPAGLFVLHSCDNTGCVNPGHLFTGTAKENTDDMMSKGRQVSRPNYGEDHHMSKLKEADVLSIRKRLSDGYPAELIGEQFGVCESSILNIKHGRTWANA